MATKQYRTVDDLPDWVKFITGGLAGCVAEFATIPLDTASVDGTYKYKGLINTTKRIYSEDGFFALYKGLVAGFQRQLVFASIRIGLYEPVRNLYCGKDFKGDPPLSKKILAGLTTGAIGIAIANPTDVIKIRFQVDGNKPPSERRYLNVRDAYRKIYMTEGVTGFWRAVLPNMLRNSVINSAELATFDQAREFVLRKKLLEDNFYCYLSCSIVAGTTAAVIGQPVDLIKTRIMNQKQSIGQIFKDARRDGFLSFYNGFSANAGRIVSWNIVMFVSLGQIRTTALQSYRNKSQY